MNTLSTDPISEIKIFIQIAYLLIEEKKLHIALFYMEKVWNYVSNISN